MRAIQMFIPMVVMFNIDACTRRQDTAAPVAIHLPRTDPARPEPDHSDAASVQPKPDTEDTKLLSLLPRATLSLAEGIDAAERYGGSAISAKFEMEDGRLSLSVYTAKLGLENDAEHNVLAELSGDPTRAAWEAKEEVFSDSAHIARASYHLTLVQRSHFTLQTAIRNALEKQPGVVYAVTPAVRDRMPVYHVSIAATSGPTELYIGSAPPQTPVLAQPNSDTPASVAIGGHAVHAWTFDDDTATASPEGFVFGRTGKGAQGRWIVRGLRFPFGA